MKTKMTYLSVAILSTLAAAALPGTAATLVGSSLTGSLVFQGDPSNYFDPGYGFAPPADLNAMTNSTTVAVSASKVEFGYDDGSNTISADFTASGITLTDAVELSGSNLPFTMTFVDPSFANGNLVPQTQPLSLIGSYSLTGDVLTVNVPAADVSAGSTFTDTLNFTTTPEPSSLGFFCVALFGLLSMRTFRRRRLG